MKAFVALFVAATPAGAAELVIDSTPTLWMPGFTTHRFSIELQGGEVFTGVDADFEGALHQMPLFGSLWTVFRDLNNLHPGDIDIGDFDTQFLFFSTDLVAVDAEEGNDFLRGTLLEIDQTDRAGGGEFAQVVADQPWNVTYDLRFDVGTGEAVAFRGRLIPEPPAAALAVWLAAVAGFRRRVTSR